MAKKAHQPKKIEVSTKEPKKETSNIPKKDSNNLISDESYLKSIKSRDLVSKAKTLFKGAYDARKKYDWEWLTRDLYRRGYHFSRYDSSSKTVVLSTRQKAQIPINLVWSQMRVIRNQVVAFKPKWEVLPKGKSDSSISNAKYSGKLLDYYYDKLNLRGIIKKTVTQGLTYSVGGPWQVGYDQDANKGKGEVFIWHLDTYDFYIDPYARTLPEAEYCIKAVRKPLDEILKNPNYYIQRMDIKGDQKLAASEYKQFLLQSLTYQQQGSTDEEEGTILKEAWIKTRVTEDNQKDLASELKDCKQNSKDLRLGEVLMRTVIFIDQQDDPLFTQTLRRSDFPFVLYEADVEPVSLYGESWMKHIIPMNRVLDNLESSIYEYNHRYAKGRLAIQKHSGVRIVANRHGDIVEYNAGSNPPTAIPLNALQPSYDLQIQNMRRYIEDIGGAHDVSLGRIPTGVKSGIGIAELKSADATNQQDLVDNLEDFLVLVGKKVLKEIAENYDVPQLIEALGKSGNPEHFTIIGEDFIKNRKNKKEVRIGEDTFNIGVIGKENEVRVSVGSWLAYTKTAQQDKLKEYYEAGIIDRETFLQYAEFSDIEAIVEKTKSENLLSKMGDVPAQPGMPTDEEIAEQENNMMKNEGILPTALKEDNHVIHIIVHQKLLSAGGNELANKHIEQHNKFLREGAGREAQRAVPAVQSMQQQMPMAGELPQEQMPTSGIPSPQLAMQQPPGSPEEQQFIESLQGLMG